MTIPIDVSQAALFADELLACADAATPNFVVVSADATSSLRLTAFRDRYPDRVFEAGIAEGCALATAFGLSRTGLKVFVVGYSNFLLMRGIEVIRSYLAYHRSDVTILGAMAGLTASYDGFMHQAIDDIGLLRAIEGMEIVIPSDELSSREWARRCVHEPGPRYVRLVRRELRLPPAVGPLGDLVWRENGGNDVLLLSFGPLLQEVIASAAQLRGLGIGADVLEVGRVAPAPLQALRAAAASYRRVVVVEDHIASAGLGALVREALRGTPHEIRWVGLTAASAGSGTYEAVLKAAGLTVSAITAAALTDTQPSS